MSKTEESNIFTDPTSGRQFRYYRYFDHTVVQDVETGWIAVGKFVKAVAEINGKQINIHHFRESPFYEQVIEIFKNVQREDFLPPQNSKVSDFFVEYKTGFGENVRSAYAPFKIFQIVALWIDKKHLLEVLDLLERINEYANLNGTSATAELEALTVKYEEENKQLRQENEELKAQMKDDNSPFNNTVPTWIYALKINDEYFQLRFMKTKPSTAVKSLKNIPYTNADKVLGEFRYYGKRLGYYYKYREKNVCKRSDLEVVFQILDEIKHNTFDLYKYKPLPTLITDEIDHLKAKDTTTQIAGKIFELEYCRDNNYIPWKLQPPQLLHENNEERRDKGIDFIDVVDGKITIVGQIKVRGCGKINETEIRKFITKASTEKYKDCKRILVTKDCLKLPNKLLKLLVKENVKLVML